MLKRLKLNNKENCDWCGLLTKELFQVLGSAKSEFYTPRPDGQDYRICRSCADDYIPTNQQDKSELGGFMKELERQGVTVRILK